MSIINNGLLLASGADAAVGYQISRSLRFNSADTAYLSRTPGSAGNRKTWTWSAWVKRARLGTEEALFACGTSGSDTAFGQIIFSTGDTLRVNAYGTTWRDTSQVFRDCSAWYHIVVAFDTTQSTANDRVKVYVNGQQVTSWGIINNPTQNTDYAINQNIQHTIGRFDLDGGGNYLSAYLADIYFLDGTATTPSTFAETDAVTGQWVPKTPASISYGTNGFRLTFSDNSGTTSTTLGKDAAGSNNWSPNNFSVASGSGNDSLTDSPTSYGTDTGAGGEVRGNYCVANPLDNGGITLANGNLDLSRNSGVEWLSIRGTIGMTSGKWYWEFTPTAFDQNMVLGIIDNTGIVTSYLDINARGYGYRPDGKKVNNNSTSAYGASWTTNDVIGFAFNADNQELTFYKNGVSQGVAFTVTAGYTYFPAASLRVAGGSSSGTYNFGARAFSYQAPSGFKALCDTNLTAPTIAKPNTVMDVKLYTGTGSSNAITGLNFSPDLVWLKVRNNIANHWIVDAVRGAGAGGLSSSTTSAEGNTERFSSFDANGFTVASGAGETNESGKSFVGWCWDAGTSTVTNNNGSISSQVRANASAGFSIVTYTGTGSLATVGHGLGAAPSFIIVKARSTTYNWSCYHISTGKDYVLNLNTTGAGGSGANSWGTAAPTSTVFGVKDAGPENNGSGVNFVAYCFAPVAGYSNAFTYSGTGSTDGPFCFLGFRPRLILLKVSNTTGPWYLFDTARNTYNVMNNRLEANSSAAEASDRNVIDALSNGFKLRDVDAVWNQSGNTYVGFAWAESPFQYARAR